MGIPRLGAEGHHQRCLPSAPWRFSQGRFLLVFTLPTRGPGVLLLKGRAGSMGSESQLSPYLARESIMWSAMDLKHSILGRPSSCRGATTLWSFPSRGLPWVMGNGDRFWVPGNTPSPGSRLTSSEEKQLESCLCSGGRGEGWLRPEHSCTGGGEHRPAERHHLSLVLDICNT